jgi:membrane associated rhomboid family serine protease
MPPLQPATRALLLINVAAFFLVSSGLLGSSIAEALMLWPIGPHFMPWQLVTYAFLHLNFAHLFFNMLGLWMFGSELERIWGERRYLQFYFASLLAAAVTQLVVTGLMGNEAPTVGASGALFGLLLAFAMMFPNRIILLFFVVPMRARWLVLLYGVLELYQGIYVNQDGVAHFAHLGGMAGGLLMIRYWRGQAPFGRRR